MIDSIKKHNLIICCILLLLSTIFTNSCFSSEQKKNIVLLTSINNEEYRTFWRTEEWKIDNKLEKVFKNRFGNSGYNLIVIHQANQSHLFKYLNSSQTIGLFWVSHSGKISEELGVGVKPHISDINKNNVAPLFRQIHKNIKWVSIISCLSQDIINRLISDGVYRNNKDLVLDGHSNKIKARKGLNNSITRSARVLSKDPINVSRKFYRNVSKNNNSYRLRSLGFDRYPHNYPEFLRMQNSKKIVARDLQFASKVKEDSSLSENTHTFEITRTIEENVESKEIQITRIVLGRKIIAIFPKGLPGEVQKQTIHLSTNKIKELESMDIEVHSGAATELKRDISLGRYEFTASWSDSQYELFANIDGVPFGFNHHLYFSY